MVWEEFLNKSVKIQQKDGFIKRGVLKEITSSHLVIEFLDGSGKNVISKEFILNLQENAK